MNTRKMISTHPQASDWTTIQSSAVQHPFPVNKTGENYADLSNTNSIHDEQCKRDNYEKKRRDFSCTLLKRCSCMSPLLQGLILGILTGCLILAIVISIWLTSTTTTTTQATESYSITTSNNMASSLTSASSTATTGPTSSSSSATAGPASSSATTGSTSASSIVTTVPTSASSAVTTVPASSSSSATIGSTSVSSSATTVPVSSSSSATTGPTSSSSSTTIGSTSVSSSATTVVASASSIVTTGSTNPSTTTQTTGTTTTPAFNSCNNLRWNQTGVIVAGTTQGSAANQLKNPTCLYIDGNDTLYICDENNNRIQKWVQGAISGVTVAGSSTGVQGATSTLLSRPIDITFDKNGYMYVVDNNNNRVQCFAPNSTIGTTVAGRTGSSSSALTDLEQPTAIDIDNNSNIYVLDANNRRVVQWAPNATNGTALISNTLLNNAYDLLLAPGSSNQVYICGQVNHDIYLWSFGSSNASITLSMVNDTITSLNNPMGIALDAYGSLYVADTNNDRVVMFCGTSTVGIVVAKDNGGTPSLNQPMAVAFDSDLNLYVLTRFNAQVIKFSRI